MDDRLDRTGLEQRPDVPMNGLGDGAFVRDRPRPQRRAGDGETPLHDRLDVQLRLGALERRDLHEPSFRGQHVDVAREVGAANHVEDDIHAAPRSLLAYHRQKIGVAVVDAAFGAEQRLRGKTVEVNTTQFTESMHRIFSGRLAQETGAALHDLRTAATTLAYGVTLHGTQEVFTIGEHIESLIATTAAVSTLETYLMAPELEEAVELALDADLEPPIYLERALREDLELEGVPWPPERRWPLPGAPRTITGDAMMQMGVTLIPAALGDLLRPRRDEVVSTFVGALVNQLVERSAIWLTGSDDAIQYQDAPVYQIMTSLALVNRWPNVGAGEAKIALFFELAENHMAYSARNSLDASELDLLAKRSGITLLRGGPPDTPYPPGLGT